MARLSSDTGWFNFLRGLHVDYNPTQRHLYEASGRFLGRLNRGYAC